MKTDKKIEGIIDINGAVWTPPAPKNKRKAIKELSTLIQEERENAYSSGFDDCKKLTDILVGIKKKEAVEGFAYYLLKRRNKDEFWGLSEGEVEMAMIVAKQYLESEK